MFNINRALKNIKSDTIADFIHADNRKLTITTNKVAFTLDLNTIKKYINNVDNIDLEDVMLSRLSQSKSYLKIFNISYLIKNTNVSISTDIVERVLHLSYIFNNIILTSKPHAIKVSLKSDIAVIQINIQDTQSGSKAKRLINRCFNIESHIATIRNTNMNPGILQCKNCWRQDHTMFAYHLHRSKYIKCNSPHKVKNHMDLS